MNRGAVVALLSFLFYFTTILGGEAPQPVETLVPPAEQASYEVLGQAAQIALDAVTVRSAPSAQAEALGVIKKDTPRVLILDKQDGWYRIRPSSGPTGWVPEHAVAITHTAPKLLDQIVLGFYEPGGAAYETLLEHSDKLTAVAPLGWSLDSYGGLNAGFDPQEMGRSLYFAGNQELLTFAHVQLNHNPAPMLQSPALQRNAISRLGQIVEEWGVNGLILHLAYTPSAEQAELFAFAAALRQELAARGGRLLLSLPFKDGLDYGAAAQAGDYLVLRSAPELTEPGPSAAQPELDRMLAEVTQAVQAGKIILALPTSGLDWPRAGQARVLSHAEVMELAAAQGAKIRWDSASLTPYFQYGNGREVWFENRYSLKQKLELVSKYKLAGTALVNLGQEDPAVWESAAALLRS